MPGIRHGAGGRTRASDEVTSWLARVALPSTRLTAGAPTTDLQPWKGVRVRAADLVTRVRRARARGPGADGLRRARPAHGRRRGGGPRRPVREGRPVGARRAPRQAPPRRRRAVPGTAPPLPVRRRPLRAGTAVRSRSVPRGGCGSVPGPVRLLALLPPERAEVRKRVTRRPQCGRGRRVAVPVPTACGGDDGRARRQLVARSCRVSMTRFEKPHSLSYQATTLT